MPRSSLTEWLDSPLRRSMENECLSVRTPWGHEVKHVGRHCRISRATARSIKQRSLTRIRAIADVGIKNDDGRSTPIRHNRHAPYMMGVATLLHLEMGERPDWMIMEFKDTLAIRLRAAYLHLH